MEGSGRFSNNGFPLPFEAPPAGDGAQEPRLSVRTSPPAPPRSSQPGAQTHRGEGAKPGHALLQTKAGPATYKYPQGDGTREHTDKGQILQMFESLDLQSEEG